MKICLLESENYKISNLFNNFFTNINSNSLKPTSDSYFDNYTLYNLSKFVNTDTINSNVFSFQPVNNYIVNKLLNDLIETSGPGITGISAKVLKASNEVLSPMLTEFFNLCLKTQKMPDEWKTAICTPLFKNKGQSNDVNNYRSISVLPPLAKIFEKILASQIVDYFNAKNLFFEGQFGFRASHSCESALHRILSEINNIKNKRLIGLLLFIDFRKAFDLVDSKLLIKKLKIYGFNESAANLLTDYFKNRSQFVNYGDELSDECSINLGVPQGSCLGPILFLIYINDLPHSLDVNNCILFADDSTLMLIENDFQKLMNKFSNEMRQLIDWCDINRFDINWSKTEIMFVTNKRKIILPDYITFESNMIKVVSEFKLLGITFDNKLTFKKYISDLKRNVNQRIYAIKNLFYLSKCVKIQFFKSFILPFFDYCLSLIIYFPKYSIQRLSNFYNICLYKLFKFKFKIIVSNDFNLFNNFLNANNLSCFQHRILKKLILYSHNIINNIDSPSELKSQMVLNSSIDKGYDLRNKNNFSQPLINSFNNFGVDTFSYFFPKFINNIYINDLNIKKEFLEKRIENNINIYFDKFVNIFPKFDLNYISYFP